MPSSASTTITDHLDRRKRFTPERREQWLAAQREREEAAARTLTQGVSRMAEVQGWRGWLDFAARLPRYSVVNQVLLASQCPHATRVMSASAWRGLGRYPRRGSTALRIWAPRSTRPDQQPAAAGAAEPPDTQIVADATVEPRLAEGPRYILVPVFDVSQTEGDPLPARPTPIAPPAGRAPAGIWEALVGYAREAGYMVTRGDTGPADGCTNFAHRMIRINPRGSELAQALTLAHEIGHMSLHAGTPTVDPLSAHRGRAEVQAESVAYLVAADFGLTSAAEWHFDYLAHWAARMGPDAAEVTGRELRDTAGSVLAAARPLLEHLHSEGVGHTDPLARASQPMPPPPAVAVAR